jgi:hypothetical protein
MEEFQFCGLSKMIELYSTSEEVRPHSVVEFRAIVIFFLFLFLQIIKAIMKPIS